MSKTDTTPAISHPCRTGPLTPCPRTPPLRTSQPGTPPESSPGRPPWPPENSALPSAPPGSPWQPAPRESPSWHQRPAAFERTCSRSTSQAGIVGVEAGGAPGRQEQFASVDKRRCPLLRSESPFLFSSSLARALSLFFLQFAKSVVIWCQRLIQPEGGNGEQKTCCHRAASREQCRQEWPGPAPRPPRF